jgi:hypothetical protein
MRRQKTANKIANFVSTLKGLSKKMESPFSYKDFLG